MSTAAITLPINEPIDLRQRDRNSCLSCVAANVLHMFDAGPADSRWVDRKIGRARGVEASYVQVCLLLQACGLRLWLVGEFSPELFLTHGLDYLRAYHRYEWTPEWDEYWTPRQVEVFRRDCLDARALVANGAAEEYREPTVDDLLTVVSNGGAASISVSNGDPVGGHAELVYGYDSGWFDVYSPQHRGTCLYGRSGRSIARSWLTDQGLVGVWP